MLKLKESWVLIFLYLQPFLDLLTSLQMHFGHSSLTIGMVVRVLFLLCLCILFIKNNHNFKDYLYLIIFALYIVGFFYIIFIDKGSSAFITEAKTLFRIIYLPIVLYLSTKLKLFKIDPTHLVYIYAIYLLFLIIPSLLGKAFEGYFQGKIGNIGWFYSTNEISGILCILMPIVFHYLLKIKGNIYFKIILFISLIYSIFSLGTKLSVVTFGILVVGYFIKYLYQWFKEKRTTNIIISIVVLVAILIAGIILVPKSNFYYNIVYHLNYLNIHSISDALNNEIFLDHFVFSSRLSFLNQTHRVYLNESFMQKLFGIGIIENYQTVIERIKFIEMDPFDIFYRIGIIGSLLFIYPFFNLPKKEKNQWTTIKIISIIIAFIIATLAGHILIAPAVSIYIVYSLINEEPQCASKNL